MKLRVESAPLSTSNTSRAIGSKAARKCCIDLTIRVDFRVGSTDVRLGEIDGVPVWISGPQYEVWKETQLILDVVPGRGGVFSLDNGRERRFLTRARILTPAELAALEPVTVGS